CRARSILVREHHGNDRRAVVAGGAQCLGAHERRCALAVVVADVDAEADLRPTGNPADNQPQHRGDIPQSPRLILADDPGRAGDALPPGGRGPRPSRRDAYGRGCGLPTPSPRCWSNHSANCPTSLPMSDQPWPAPFFTTSFASTPASRSFATNDSDCC